MKENEVPADVIRDLIPLVKDGVASEDSVRLVHDRLLADEAMKQEFEQYVPAAPSNRLSKDERIIRSVKRSLFVTKCALLLAGATIGVAMSNSFGLFYNLLLMPFIGALAWFSFRWSRALLAPGAVFLLTYSWRLAASLHAGGWNAAAFSEPLFYSAAYGVLVGIGLLIAFLLQFAFRKEEPVDETT